MRIPARLEHALLAGHATYNWADELFRCLDLDPAATKFIIAKSFMN
jgi:hypothetical protein